MDSKWKKLKSETSHQFKIFDIRKDFLVNPRNNQTVEVTVLETKDAANIFAITDNDQVIMIRQYRFGIEDYTLEFAGGFIEDKEASQAGAERELSEETGYGGGTWIYLGKIAANPSFQDSYIHHWLALDVQKTHELNLDLEEDVKIVLYTLDEIKNLLDEMKINHPHAISCLYYGLKYLGQLT